MSIPLWMRRKFFDSYGSRLNERLAGLSPTGSRVTCPCCGYPTLGDRATYEICELCSWEDDGQDAPNADEVWGGPNQGYSLTEAQLNFERHLVMYPPGNDLRIGGADNEKVKTIKRALIASFDKIMKEPPSEELNALWKEINAHEKSLYREEVRTINQHSEWE